MEASKQPVLAATEAQATRLGKPSNKASIRRHNGHKSADRQSGPDQVQLLCEKISHVISPVTMGCLYTCILIRLAAFHLREEDSLLDMALSQMKVNTGDFEGQLASISIIFFIVFLFCCIIVLLTLFVLLIFYMRWHICLAYYSYLPTLITLIAITPLFARDILQALNWFALDVVSVAILIWNFTIFGVISIFGPHGFKGPLVCQQFYLIHNSSLLAVLIIQILPSWAPWLLLIFMVVWDSFAVLAPIGPLNLILSMAEAEGVKEMPGLVYSTESYVLNNHGLMKRKREIERERGQKANLKKLVPSGQAGLQEAIGIKAIVERAGAKKRHAPSESSMQLDDENQNSPQPVTTIESEADQSPEEELDHCSFSHSLRSKRQTRSRGRGELVLDGGGTNIGVGDFVFYSLLVGLTVRGRNLGEFYTALASLVAILVGLTLTLIILALLKRSLPAVPLSVGLGVLVAFATRQTVPQLADKLASEAIFI